MLFRSQEKYIEMRKKKKLNHHLGSRGKEGKKKVWDKEDAQMAKDGIVPPLKGKLKHERTEDFMRMHMRKEQWAGQEDMQEDLQEVWVRQ